MANQLPPEDLAAASAVAGLSGVAAIAAAEAAAMAVRTMADTGGGHYQFHPDELNSVINGWQGIVNTLHAAQTTVTAKAPHSPAVLQPGNEMASTTVSNAAHTTNLAYQDHLSNTLGYAQGFLDHLIKARDNYLTTEHGQAAVARQLEA
jgi:hypothetical protein